MERDVQFEWDPIKAAENGWKHRVTFEEASTVLGDPHMVTVPDGKHSSQEDRGFTIGMSSTGRLIAVAWTRRGATIRIITSRPATRREARNYHEGP